MHNASSADITEAEITHTPLQYKRPEKAMSLDALHEKMCSHPRIETIA